LLFVVLRLVRLFCCCSWTLRCCISCSLFVAVVVVVVGRCCSVMLGCCCCCTLLDVGWFVYVRLVYVRSFSSFTTLRSFYVLWLRFVGLLFVWFPLLRSPRFDGSSRLRSGYGYVRLFTLLTIVGFVVVDLRSLLFVDCSLICCCCSLLLFCWLPVVDCSVCCVPVVAGFWFDLRLFVRLRCSFTFDSGLFCVCFIRFR
jgi:hypothetical protein